jgi:hypothetical protein
MTFKIFSQAPETRREDIILAPGALPGADACEALSQA